MTKNYWFKVLSVFIIVSAICAGVICGVISVKNKRQASRIDELIGSGDETTSGDSISSGETNSSNDRQRKTS